MTGLVLAWQAAMWLVVSCFFLRSRKASLFHPLAYYLFFHGLVFVLWPILEYAFGLDTTFYLMQFFPAEEQKQTALLLTTVGLLAFAAASWMWDASTPHFDRPVPDGFGPAEWQGFAILAALLGPIALYSAATYIAATLPNESGTDLIGMARDVSTGIATFTNTSGYIVDAQLMLGTFCLMLIWGTRFRGWSFIPLLTYLADRAYVGWGRWSIILIVAMLGLLALFRRRRRWAPAYLGIFALPVLLLFQQLGQDRSTFQSLIVGERGLADVLSSDRSLRERLDSPDFANFDFLTFVIDVVPGKSDTYTYFSQYLQLLTEPIPRILWPDKPIGPPIGLVNLNDYGNFVGWTVSLVGDGWMSLGWLGVIVTMTFVGYITARMHRWFWQGEASSFKILTYCTFVPLTVQWFRDGGISIFKFMLFTIGPLLLWRYIVRYLPGRTRIGGMTQRAPAGLSEACAGRAANGAREPI